MIHRGGHLLVVFLVLGLGLQSERACADEMEKKDPKIAYIDALEQLQVVAETIPGNNHFEPRLSETLSLAKEHLRLTWDNTEAIRDVAGSANNLAVLAREMGAYPIARIFLEISLSARRHIYPRARFPNGAPDLATTLIYLGILSIDMAEMKDAEEFLVEAYFMSQGLFPQEEYPTGHPTLALCLHQLGVFYSSKGDLIRAEKYYRPALNMYIELYPQENFPEGWDKLARTFSSLGVTLHKQHRLTEARGYLEAAIGIAKGLHTDDHAYRSDPEVATWYNNYASLLYEQGEFRGAAVTYEDSLEIYRRAYPESAFPQGHPLLAAGLNNLGFVHKAQGDHEAAQVYLAQALAMKRNLYPKSAYPSGHTDLALGIANLAAALAVLGRLNEATELGTEAYTMRRTLYPEAEFPAGNPAILASTNNLGEFHLATGEYSKAENYFKEALELARKLYPSSVFVHGHPGIVLAHRNLGDIYFASNRPQEAIKSLLTASEVQYQLTVNFIQFASEPEILNFLNENRGPLYLLISTLEHDGGQAAVVYEQVWKRKGLIHRVLAHRFSMSNQEGSADSPLGQYLEVSRNLAQMVIAAGQDDAASADEQHRTIRDLSDRKERLERELAERTPGLSPIKPVTQLTETLGPDAAFVDVIRYWHRDFPSLSETWAARYAIFVLRNGSPPRFLSLQADPIDDQVRKWRSEISQNKIGDASHELRRLLWEPLERLLQPRPLVTYISPDGLLTAMPWSALPAGTEQDGFLIDEYSLAFVPHGEQLLKGRDNQEDQKSRKVLVVHGVDFGTPEGRGKASEYRDAETRPPESGTIWPRLAKLSQSTLNAVRENESFREITVLDETLATSSRIRSELPHSAWAHINTHAFFSETSASSYLLEPEGFLSSAYGFERVLIPERHPFMSTGLILSGANLPAGEREESGVLTAQEIAGLDLSNLDLVILSACDTGIGQAINGDGLFSLQKAFHLAGAKNVVSSLWKVSDSATAELMKRFYTNLAKNVTPLVALRDAQRSMYQNPSPLVLSGERGIGKDPVPIENRQLSATATKAWAAFQLSGPAN